MPGFELFGRRAIRRAIHHSTTCSGRTLCVLLRAIPSVCGSVLRTSSGRTLCVLLRPCPLFVVLFCAPAPAVPSVFSSGRTLCAVVHAPGRTLSFPGDPLCLWFCFAGAPSRFFLFLVPLFGHPTSLSHTLGGLLLTLGGLLLTDSQTNKQCTHACPQLPCSRPCSCPRTPSSHTITPRLNAPSAQSVCGRGSCTSLAPPPPTASGWGRTALFVSSRCNSLPRKEPVPMYQTITSASAPSSSLYSLRNSLRLALHHVYIMSNGVLVIVTVMRLNSLCTALL